MSNSESRKAVAVRSVRLTAEQDSAVVAAAEARGVGPSTFCREAILRAAKLPVPKRSAQRDLLAAELAPVLGSLGRIGSLLNQVAKVANATGRPADVRTIEQTRVVLAQLHQAVLAKGLAE